MSHPDLPRLKDQPDTPRELRDALDALKPDEAARLARVAGKLGPLLDAAAPSAPGAATWLSGSRKLWANKLVIAGIAAIGTGALLLLRTPSPAVERPVRATSSEAVRAEPAVVTPPSPAPERALPASPQVAASVDPPGLPATQPTKPSAKRAHPRVSSANATQAASAHHDSVNPAVGGSAGALSDSIAEVAPIAPTPEPKLDEPPPSAPKPPPAPLRSEEELLFDARATRQKDPRAALKLLDEHSARFPRGLLAPEREVLAIETLRSLGKTDDASQRLAKFKVTYPTSLHLRRLESASR